MTANVGLIVFRLLTTVFPQSIWKP